MKTSTELMSEFLEKHPQHGQKALAEFLGVTQAQVSMWKTRGALSAAATIQLGLGLGYDELTCYRIAAYEAERTEKGKSLLQDIAMGKIANEYWRRGGDMNPYAILWEGLKNLALALDWRHDKCHRLAT